MTQPIPDGLTPEEAKDWPEFDQWMQQEPNEECLYIWVQWQDGTFVLAAERAREKALERFRVWRGRKLGLAQARTQLRLVQTGPKPKTPLPKINLKDLMAGAQAGKEDGK